MLEQDDDELPPPSSVPLASTPRQTRTPSPHDTSSYNNTPTLGADWRARLMRTLQPALRGFEGLEGLGARSSTPSPKHAPSPPPLTPGTSVLLPASLADEPSLLSVTPASRRPVSKGSWTSSPVPPEMRTVLLSWGNNGCGQLGFGDFSTRILPKAVEYFKSGRCGTQPCLVVWNTHRPLSPALSPRA